MQATEQEQTVYRVYLGRRIRPNNKIAYAWQDLHASGTLNAKSEGWWDKQFYSGALVGGVYAITRIVDSNQFYSKGAKGPRYSHMFDDKALITQWQLVDRTAGLLAASKSKERKEERNMLHEALASVRQAMLKTNAQGRQLLIALVLDDLAGYYKGEKFSTLAARAMEDMNDES